MYAKYTCEQCFEEYDDESEFVNCNGDACRESVCKKCAKPCKNPECKRYVCDDCRQGASAQYCGAYCIDCAMWTTKGEDWKNFDYVKRKMTYDQARAHLGLKPKKAP